MPISPSAPGNVTISWTNPTDVDLASIKITSSLGTIGFPLTKTTTSTTTTTSLKVDLSTLDLTEDTAYPGVTFTLQAIDKSGNVSTTANTIGINVTYTKTYQLWTASDGFVPCQNQQSSGIIAARWSKRAVVARGSAAGADRSRTTVR